MSELRYRESSRNKIQKWNNVVNLEDTKKQKATTYNNSHDIHIAIILFIISLPARFRHLAFPDQVIFDEAHYGKYVSYYIKQKLFFDVHPPLAKLLISFIAWISGYDGEFDFSEVGSKYPKDVPYVQMRALGALLGSLVVPLAYFTIRNAGHSNVAAIITALAICFENGLITNNRLILLDSYFLFFTAFTIFSYIKFFRQKFFSRSWWTWLLVTGISLGCTLSSKWVGLLTAASIGLSTAEQLWKLLGNTQVSMRQCIMHLFARCICLILIPIIIYLGSFYIHFSILTQPGPGSSYMTIETQSELKGIPPIDTQVPVTYGSLITIRHLETTGGYLHSHFAYYPDGSNQQQVTLYPYKDNNNWWRILKADPSVETQHDLLANDNKTWLEYVRDGDMVRLEHVTTAPRKLHSHNFPAPVTDTDYHREVSGYGFVNYTGDSNDFWRVQILKNTKSPEANQRLEARRSQFRLFHSNQECHLYSNFEKLPEWGFGQQEVSCIIDGLRPRTMWMIDETENELLPDDVPIEPEHRPNFFEKLVHLHKAMWLSQKYMNDDHPYRSKPSAWPLLQTKIAFWFSDTTQIFLFGNPFVYWASTAVTLTCITLFIIFQITDKRGYRLGPYYGHLRVLYGRSAGFFVCGWILHYFPFYFIQEHQLFLHHYMPALYFAVLTLGVCTEFIMNVITRSAVIRLILAGLISTCILSTYFVFTPITYGEPWTVAACERATSSYGWDLKCNRYAPLHSFDRTQFIMQETESSEKDEEHSYTAFMDKNVHFVDQPPKSEKEDLIEYSQELFESDAFEEGEEEEEEDIEEEDNEEEEDIEEEEEEDILDEPTEAPIIEEPEPQFIDGKEVFGDDDDDDEWPKTQFGVDPELDEDEEPTPLTTREIPITRYE
ncbi:Dolichyl-phosphate-mannose-protein mannosyltransferase-domain-containing protein [Cokeromyces recurvatus]|uniref:Dolichyl-phosphate-mannose-protein mannosyltransferase-domain-containing protein n=1 Tax=Cokeromyces recurvatus TaxID=90255 RepID=UPI00222029AF|nr:Dolichyl-phosphate-mannose-protein mannosyltransferase-domain-containing protein [Cokeromyces recurvatus]KAI7907634.1 Dolichyl-phosphate-mannose-protein mannosyltransferase-domain-containing protein [Cokeromyces recurvatus]